MDRRKYLKTLAVGSVGAGLLLQCKPDNKDAAPDSVKELNYDRTEEEKAREKELMSEQFFDEHEMKTISVLSDIIIPKDGTSGSATDAGVPDFIEFMAKDRPEHQLPLRGGIKWLDLQCMQRYNADFISCTDAQQIEMVDEIAYPEKAKAGMQPGVAFFQWNGVPQEVLDQYGLAYDARTLEISVKFDS
jgi:gluconate 2-dehydrogenase gamma chain